MNRATILEEIRRNVDLLSVTDQPEYQYIPLHQKPSPSVTALRGDHDLAPQGYFSRFLRNGTGGTDGFYTILYGCISEQAYDLLQEQIYNGLCFEVERCL